MDGGLQVKEARWVTELAVHRRRSQNISVAINLTSSICARTTLQAHFCLYRCQKFKVVLTDIGLLSEKWCRLVSWGALGELRQDFSSVTGQSCIFYTLLSVNACIAFYSANGHLCIREHVSFLTFQTFKTKSLQPRLPQIIEVVSNL